MGVGEVSWFRANKNLVERILLGLLWVESHFICSVFIAENENFKCLSNRTERLSSFNYIYVNIS